MPIERHPTFPGVLHPLRSTDLTCSDLGAAFGVRDAYKTPLELYAEKTGMLKPAADNNLMRRGRWLEPAILFALAETHPDWVVRKANVYLRDPLTRLGCTPDALAIIPEVDGIVNLQMKVVSRPTFERWGGRPPDAYRLQTVGEGMLLDAATSMLVCLVIGNYSADLVEFDVPRWPELEQSIQRKAVEFWENVRNDRRPKVDPERDAETVNALYPEPKPDSYVDLIGDNLLPGMLEARAELKEEISVCEKAVKKIDTEIKAKLGEAELGILKGWKISWPKVIKKEYTVPAAEGRRLMISRANEEQAA